MDFRIPISRVRSMTAVYMAWKMTMKPMINGDADHHVNERGEPGIAADRHHGKIFAHGADRLGLHAPACS